MLVVNKAQPAWFGLAWLSVACENYNIFMVNFIPPKQFPKGAKLMDNLPLSCCEMFFFSFKRCFLEMGFHSYSASSSQAGGF